MLRLSPSSPNLNAFAERFVLSIRTECLDRIVPPRVPNPPLEWDQEGACILTAFPRALPTATTITAITMKTTMIAATVAAT